MPLGSLDLMENGDLRSRTFLFVLLNVFDSLTCSALKLGRSSGRLGAV